ncbi:MAG: hypothetical protein U5K74_02295 [Gemmatimonadaceae bacterium]|nr:hypothetical protein [Gemmatimonadaceae bacterium]
MAGLCEDRREGIAGTNRRAVIVRRHGRVAVVAVLLHVLHQTPPCDRADPGLQIGRRPVHLVAQPLHLGGRQLRAAIAGLALLQFANVLLRHDDLLHVGKRGRLTEDADVGTRGSPQPGPEVLHTPKVGIPRRPDADDAQHGDIA